MSCSDYVVLFYFIALIRSLAMQQLVLDNICPLEEELPGQGYSDEVWSMRLLARECVGEYQLTELEDSLVYDDAREVSDRDLAYWRKAGLYEGSLVQVTKTSDGKWMIGNLVCYSLGGELLRQWHDIPLPVYSFCHTQHWLDGSSLVRQYFMKKTSCIGRGETDCREVVTFGHNIFLYQEKNVYTWKSCMNNAHFYSKTHRVKAWFRKM